MVNINNILVSHCHGTGMFVTVIWGLFNTKTNTLKIVSAGHPPAILRHFNTTENVNVINVTGSALGLSTNVKYTETTVQLQPGDQLLLYTDGVYCQYENMDTINPVDKIASVFSQCKEHGIKQLYKISEMMHCENNASDDITMLLLELSPGLSQMVNAQHTTTVPEKIEPKEKQALIAVGESENGIFLKLQGQVEWTSAVSFHEICVNAITEARDTKLPLIIDFQKCVYLDSTLLGTIYEIVDLSEATSITMHLQNVFPKIRGLFQELGMEKVISHIITVPKPLPGHMTLQEITTNTNLSPQRILRAHQTLSAVNVHNQKQFGLLVESLRQEIGTIKHD